MATSAGETHSWCGYWLGPPCWFGPPNPEPLGIPGLPAEVLSAYRRVLASGGDAVVSHNGVVLIDFQGLDVDPTPSELAVAPFGDDPQRGMASVLARRRVEMLNAHQTSLLTAIGTRESEEDVWAPHPRPVNVRSLIRARDSDQVTVPPPILRELIEFSTPSQFSNVQRSLFRVTPEQTDQAFDMFERLISAPPVAISAPHLLLHAAHRYTRWEFDQALIAAWAAAEALLAHLWLQHVEASSDESKRHGYRLNKDRRRRLSGDEFTASVVGEVLALAGTIDQALYEHLAVARSARNRWVHGLRTVPSSAVESAVAAGESLLQLVSGVEVTLPLMLAEASI